MLIWTHLVHCVQLPISLQSDLLHLCCVWKEQRGQMKRVLGSYGVTYWTPVGSQTEVRAVRSSRQRAGFYMLVGVTLWVVHSKDGGQIMSCRTCTHILDFCEIIFGFPSDSLSQLWSRLFAWPQTTVKVCENIKDSATKPMGMYNNTLRANFCFLLFHMLRFSSSLTDWFICHLFWNENCKIFLSFLSKTNHVRMYWKFWQIIFNGVYHYLFI